MHCKLFAIACITGLSLLAHLAAAACSATATPPGVLSGPNGTIMTDTDGRGPEKYAPDENCTWTIECADGYHVALWDWDQAAYAYDYVRLYDDDSGAELVNTMYANSKSNAQLVTEASKLRVHFVSNSNTEGSGFTMRYMCMPGRCSARTSDFGGFTDGMTLEYKRSEADAVTGYMELRSDIDGVYQYGVNMPLETKPLPQEKCGWKLKCDRSQYKALAVEVRASMRQDGNVTVSAGDEQLMLSGGNTWMSGVRKLIVFDEDTSAANGSGVVDVAMHSGQRYIQYGTNRGFTLYYQCVEERCSNAAATGLSGSKYITNASGKIGTDIDGSHTRYYFPNEDCGWRVRCPNGENSVTFKVDGSFAAGEELRVSSPGGETLFYNKSSYGKLAHEGTVFSTGLDIAFTSDAVAESFGFNLEYNCHNRTATKSASRTMSMVVPTPVPETPVPATPVPETPTPPTPSPDTPSPETPVPATPAPATPTPETDAPLAEPTTPSPQETVAPSTTTVASTAAPGTPSPPGTPAPGVTTTEGPPSSTVAPPPPPTTVSPTSASTGSPSSGSPTPSPNTDAPITPTPLLDGIKPRSGAAALCYRVVALWLAVVFVVAL